MNTPLTDRQGRINPIWYEFLRSFISTAVDGTSGSGAGSTITLPEAGSGLIETLDENGDNSYAVGAGSGIAVNANDIAINITDLASAPAALGDEIVFSDLSDNNTIKKTQVRDLVALGSNPGGSNSHVQFNNTGLFDGNSSFTYDGSGSATLTGTLQASLVQVAGGAVNYIYFDGTSGTSGPRIQSDGAGGFTLYAKNTGSGTGNLIFGTGGNPINFNFGSGNQIALGNTTLGDGVYIQGDLPLRRSLTTNISASTTQTQGQRALTTDYNNVTTVTNANDVVTLPAALPARYCLVRNSGANVLQVFPASGDDLGNGTNTSTTITPGTQSIWYAINTTTWYQLDGIVKNSVTSGITASTTQTQGQQPLTNDVNEVSTVANANDVVTLPSATSYSRSIVIINNGANVLQIFPASGDNLGAGVDTSTTLAAGSNVRYTNYDATNWEAI